MGQEVLENLDTPIGGVQPHQLECVWEKIEPMLERVVTEDTGHTTGTVLKTLLSGLAQLWVIGDFEALMITEVLQRPLHRVLWVRYTAGDNMDDWIDDWITVAEEYAKESGCAAVEFCGRNGWNRYLSRRNKDYKPVLITCRKVLYE